MSTFKGQAAMIASIIGEVATARLLSARGGTELEIPLKVEGSLLAQLIGQADAARLQAALGPGKFTVPAGPGRGREARKRRALARLQAGESLMAVALAEDVHLRTVSRFKAELEGGLQPALQRQLDLPFDQV
ncbi:MAG: hypothetical protein MUF14_05240 [Hyphomonadaceae bacterium]|jgi:hypothetical protein|nr:hypothetical protein [Hyphomonadaceae bacterium]